MICTTSASTGIKTIGWADAHNLQVAKAV